MKFKIEKEASGKRIDAYLSEKIEKYSRSQIQRLIKNQSVLVNKKTVAPHYFLKDNDEIIFTDKKNKTKNPIIKSILNPLKKTNKSFSNIKIVAETNDYLLINKPAGLIVHGAKHIKEKTLVDYLLSKYPKIAKVGDDPERPGIVHRLDKEASGLLLVAKTQVGFDFLKNLFKTRRIKKSYIALVHGNMPIDDGIINFPIKRSADGFKMAALPLTKKGEKNIDGRTAITEFTTIKKFVNYTLLKLNIKTGRTHQIRVHLSAYGHPIAGDNLYGTKKTKEKNKKLGLNRIFLVAHQLSFIDSNSQEKNFLLALPRELNNLLKIIK